MLPLAERQAARAAIEKLVERHGTQVAAAQAIGVSQPSLNKAMRATCVGPMVMRRLLEHLGMNIEQLLCAHGGARASVPRSEALATPKEEAIHFVTKHARRVREVDVRALADRLEAYLENAPVLDWVEVLIREARRVLRAR